MLFIILKVQKLERKLRALIKKELVKKDYYLLIAPTTLNIRELIQ